MAAKVAKRPLLRYLVGSTAGAAENLALNTGVNYEMQRESGKSPKEAWRIAKKTAPIDVAVGSVSGAVGVKLAKRLSLKNQKNLKKVIVENDEDPIKLKHIDEEARAVVRDEKIKEGSLKDPNEGITQEDIELSSALNGGMEIDPAFSGYHIKEKIRNSIETDQDPKIAYEKLKQAGLKGEFLEVAYESFLEKDTEKLVEWMQKNDNTISKADTPTTKPLSEEDRALNELMIGDEGLSGDEKSVKANSETVPNSEQKSNQDDVSSNEKGKLQENKIKDFDEQLQGYHGIDAINALLANKKGHVKEAFFRDDIGAITLPYGKEGTKKSDGWGLSKIAKYHPEVLDKLEDIMETLPIIKETKGRYKLGNDKYFASIRKEYDGVRENWVLTAFEKRGDTATSRTDLDSTSAKASNQTTLESDKRELGAGSPYPTHQSGNLPPDHGDGANARSLTNDDIIPDSTKNVNPILEKDENIELLKNNLAIKHGKYSDVELIKHSASIFKKFNVAKSIEETKRIIGDLQNQLLRPRGENFVQERLDDAYAYLKELQTDPEGYVQKTRKKAMEMGKEALEKLRKKVEDKFGIKPLAEFGINYAEFYHDGKNAFKKLQSEKQGQVAGAFYREELGDIDLIWGKVSKNKQGYGLAKILSKHPEVNQNILSDIIRNGDIDLRGNNGGYNVKLDKYIVGINVGWNKNGEKIGKNKWIVTSFENRESDKTAFSTTSTKGSMSPLNSSDSILPDLEQKNNLSDRFERLSSHPHYNELLDLRKSIKAKDIKYKKKLASKAGLLRTSENEETFIKATYEDNPPADFSLTKKDVKDLKKGKLSEELLDKLEGDLGVLDYDPKYHRELTKTQKQINGEDIYIDESGQEVDKNGHIMFVKGADNLAAGIAGGLEEDEDGNLTFNPAKFVLSLGGYTAAKSTSRDKRYHHKIIAKS